MRRWYLAAGLLVHAAELSAQQPPSRPSCPDLAGVYAEEGLTYRDGKSASDVSHFSWLIGNGKERLALSPLNTTPRPGKPAVYFCSLDSSDQCRCRTL